MKAKELLWACFVFFSALLVWPLLTIANRQVLFWGVPALVLYLFLAWGAMVVVLVLVARRTRLPREGTPEAGREINTGTPEAGREREDGT